MSTTPICSAPQCDHPSPNGYLCGTCLGNLRRDLRAVPDLLTDLEITISKQDRLADPSGRKSDEHPLPLKIGPMEARRDLTATLYEWSRHTAGLAVRPWSSKTWPTVAPMAQFLLDRIDDVQRDERAGDLADEIGYAVLTVQRAVDKPLQLQYAGPCDECEVDLYARPRALEVECGNCGLSYPIAERRQWLLEQVDDLLLTAAEMSRALPNLLQHQLTSAMVRGWSLRGKLTAHPAHPENPRSPLYRLGDVVDLVHELTSGGDIAC